MKTKFLENTKREMIEKEIQSGLEVAYRQMGH